MGEVLIMNNGGICNKNVGGHKLHFETTANRSVNPTVRPVTVRAWGARPAPVRSAGYADRSTDVG